MFTAPNLILQMVTRFSVGLLVVLLVSLSGCRSARDNQIDILESELRNQEDYIYELEDYIVEYSDKLRGYRCEQPGEYVIRESPSGADYGDAISSQEADNHTVNQQTEEEAVEESAEESLPDPEQTEAPVEEEEAVEEMPEDPAEIEVPEIEFEIDEPVGMREVPQEELEEAETMFAEDDQLVAEDGEGQFIFIPDPAVSAISPAVAAEEEEFYDDALLEQVVFEGEEDLQVYRQAERLVISEILTGGDENKALLTVVEARDANNEPADIDGMVSLMVMTKDKASRRRLMRWDFSEEETLSSWQVSQLGDGLHLELPLGSSPLPAETVELWVRLMTNDGRKLLARLPFNQAKLATLGEEPESPVSEAAEQALAEAKPLKAEVAKPEKPAKPKTLWRSSTQAEILAAEGVNTGSSTTGWRASKEGVVQADRNVSPSKPVWTTGHSISSKPKRAGWSTQR